MLSLKMLFDGDAARDSNVKVALHLGGERFSIEVADGELAIARAEPESPDAIPLETDPTTLMSILQGEQSLDEVLATGRLQLAGVTCASRKRSLGSFSIPDEADAQS